MRKFVFGGSFAGIAPIDPDAQAFLTAAGITDATITSAIDTLVKDLKTASLWTKTKAIYPFVGGTASTHKWNLRNPLDTNAAFRLVFGGGVTHDSNGAQGNGTNGYGLTFIPTNSLPNSNLHASWYSRTTSTLGAFSAEIAPNTSYTAASWLTFRTNNKTSGNAYFSAGNDSVAATVSNTLNGFFIGSETASNLRKLIRNGTAIATNTTNDTNALPADNLRLWGSFGFGGGYSGNNCAFCSVGDGLSDAEALSFYNIVQAFQTTLSRNV
jgi:hypothetical protein